MNARVYFFYFFFIFFLLACNILAIAAGYNKNKFYKLFIAYYILL